MRYYLVYKTTNIINGMFYIGSHETDNKNDSYLGSGVWLRKAIKKYGKDNFRREIIQECADRDEMYSLEEKLVESVRCTPNCYNINVGGSGGWNHINESGMHKGSNNPMNRPEIKQKVLSGLKKKREENKEKYLAISLANLKKANNVGSVRTTETKRLMSVGVRKRWEENREEWLKSMRSTFLVTSPQGIEYKTDELEKFCKDNNLTYTSVWNTSKTQKPVKKGKSKGWSCKKI